MLAVRIHEHGDVDKLILEEIEEPNIKNKNEVKIRIKACALNHLDIWTRVGLPNVKINLPIIPGSDIAGIIEDVGEEVSNLKKGDKVFLYPAISCNNCEYCLKGENSMCYNYKVLGHHINGGCCEFIVVPSNIVFQIPNEKNFEEASSIPLVFITAYRAIFTKAKPNINETVFVWSAGSGVGIASIQLLKLINCTVISTVGNDEKVEKAYKLGCDYVINYKKQDVLKEVKEFTKGRGVDIVIEHIGKDTLDISVKMLKKGGKIITFGATSGYLATLDIRYFYSRQLSIIGSYIGSIYEFIKVIDLYKNGKIKAVIDSVYSIKDIKEAHKRMESKEHFGKIVLKI